MKGKISMANNAMYLPLMLNISIFLEYVINTFFEMKDENKLVNIQKIPIKVEF